MDTGLWSPFVGGSWRNDTYHKPLTTMYLSTYRTLSIYCVEGGFILYTEGGKEYCDENSSGHQNPTPWHAVLLSFLLRTRWWLFCERVGSCRRTDGNDDNGHPTLCYFHLHSRLISLLFPSLLWSHKSPAAVSLSGWVGGSMFGGVSLLIIGIDCVLL